MVSPRKARSAFSTDVADLDLEDGFVELLRACVCRTRDNFEAMIMQKAILRVPAMESTAAGTW